MKNKAVVGAVCLVVMALMVGGGCSGSDIFSTTYQNTVAYFNTYYNAEKTFDEAREETEKPSAGTLRANPFLRPNVPAAVRPKFNAVIEKCSKIIQFYPNSNLVDNALLLIGKSYYYLNELLPAQRKFSELLENFPRSELRFETMLMLAKTHYLAEKENDALELLNVLVAESTEEEDIAIEGLLLQGQIHADRNDLPRAVESYTRALEVSGNDALLGLAAYRLGQSHESTDSTESAIRSYLRVLDFSHDFPLEFDARLRAGSLYSVRGNNRTALNLLEELQSEILSPEQRSRVELELGNTYGRGKEYEKALLHYETVDSLYKRTDAAAKSNYQRGILYEKVFFDLQRAKTCYDKAKSEFPQSEIAPLAAKKSDVSGRYLLHRSELSKYDSLLRAHLYPRPVIDSSAAIDSLKEAFGDTSVVRVDSLAAARARKTADSLKALSVPVDTVHNRRAMHQLALGILFFVDLQRPDSSRYYLTSMMDEYPGSRFVPQALYVLAEVCRSTGEQPKVDSLYDILLSKYPDSDYAVNVRKIKGESPTPAGADSAEADYGNAMRYHEEGNSKQAVQELRKVVRKYPDHPVNPKARYAIGWIFENVIINKDSALVHYRLLQKEHPASVYTDRVRPKLSFLESGDGEGKSPGGMPDTTAQQGTKKLPVEKKEPEEKPSEEKDESPVKKGDGGEKDE